MCTVSQNSYCFCKLSAYTVWSTFWWRVLLFQHCGSCVDRNSWLLPTSYLITDLILTWRLCNVSQAWGPNLSLHVYWYCIDLKDMQRAADYLTGNTSCIVLNFAWSHWPGYSFIINGNGRKAAKWIHTHACIHAYLNHRTKGRFKGASGRRDTEADAVCFTAWNTWAMWLTRLVCLCLYMRVWTQSVLRQKRVRE